MEEEMKQMVSTIVATDPAPNPQNITMRRLDELLAQASDHAVEELRQLRDDVDHTIRAIQERQELVRSHFEDHIANIVSAIKFRETAAENLMHVRERFAKGLSL